MAGLTERSLDHAIKGLLQRDDDLCTKTIADDEEVDQLEKQIDKVGVEILLRYQPVASDLRQVVSAMKLSPNIERVADEATNIAESARKLISDSPLAEVKLIVPIQAHAISMFKDGIDAFAREDVDAGASGRQPRQGTRRYECLRKPPTDRTDDAGPRSTTRLSESDLNLALSRTRG